jgi:hypothetical protein
MPVTSRQSRGTIELSSMIQKIEVIMKKVRYVDPAIDNKSYLCKDNQFRRGVKMMIALSY